MASLFFRRFWELGRRLTTQFPNHRLLLAPLNFPLPEHSHLPIPKRANNAPSPPPQPNVLSQAAPVPRPPTSTSTSGPLSKWGQECPRARAGGGGLGQPLALRRHAPSLVTSDCRCPCVWRTQGGTRSVPRPAFNSWGSNAETRDYVDTHCHLPHRCATNFQPGLLRNQIFVRIFSPENFHFPHPDSLSHGKAKA